MSTVEAPVYEWNMVDWSKTERRVFKLQKRIYQASARGDVKTVHSLQRLLMKSWSAKCLAVRKVTQDNQGKRTAGVDGVKNLAPERRVELVSSLHLRAKAKPTRRVWIPKPGTTEKRPLGIPVMWDRAAQALVKLALEPEWEARFEPNSYGFRPGRSAHDALEAIFTTIRQRPKYVLDADIAKCFDRIDHTALLRKLATFPTLRKVIKRWLKAGVMEGLVFTTTDAGTPQGGIVSPLLANIALHGLETVVRVALPARQGKHYRRPIQLVRYADDFVILHDDLSVIEKSKQVVATWLNGLGLELKPSKTRVTHTLNTHEGQVGFDFLGFNIRQHVVGKANSGKHIGGHLLGFKTIITPSKEAQHRHLEAIRKVVQKNKTVPQAALIGKLNPLITGWVNYFSTVCSKETFSHMDALTYAKLQRWAQRRHPRKSHHWVATKYWHPEEGTWTFHVPDGKRLYRHAEKHIARHTKVEGTRSFFDGDWAYWATRLGRHPELRPREARLFKDQQGRCSWCGLRFTSEDLREIDHIVPTSLEGQDVPRNLQLLHRHCHDNKSAVDGSTPTKRCL
jgi:RNA-directed DNA polymerase